jgi:hypothetical protein
MFWISITLGIEIEKSATVGLNLFPVRLDGGRKE